MTFDKNIKENKTIEDNNEILINYVIIVKRWNRTNVVVDNIFVYNVALDIISKNEDSKRKSVEECWQRKDRFLSKEAIEVELNSLSKRQVFGSVVQTQEGVKPVRYKWAFVRKRNENNEITRYKTRLVAQGFS